MGASRAFLATYRPLCRTPSGRQAVAKYGLFPYVDGSCRREPDLEAQCPTITALCRGHMFAPRLREGDRVAYVTKLGCYEPRQPAHRRLTALLSVDRRFENHGEAAQWFEKQSLPIPRNCIVPATSPLSLDQTDGELRSELRALSSRLSPVQIVRLWDAAYAKRAEETGVVLACRVLFRELISPPMITRADWQRWCGRVPSTRTPPSITHELWQSLAERAASTPIRQ
jgi:hypothetical protein